MTLKSQAEVKKGRSTDSDGDGRQGSALSRGFGRCNTTTQGCKGSVTHRVFAHKSNYYSLVQTCIYRTYFA